MSGAVEPLAALEVFSGDANPVEARIYARLPNAGSNEQTLAGTVRGPLTELARTLPATVPLMDRGLAPALLAESIVPDPCLWAPGEPFLYRVDVELRTRERPPRALASATRWLGIRAMGVRGHKFVIHGKPWVLRAVSDALAEDADWNAWRDAACAQWTPHVNAERLEAASRTGVPIVADFSACTVPIPAEIERLAAWPALVMAVLPPHAPVEAVAVLLRHRVAVSSKVNGSTVNGAIADSRPSWASVAVVNDRDLEAYQASKSPAVPVVVRRAATRIAALAQGRAACDRLQADVAGLGDWAGYCV